MVEQQSVRVHRYFDSVALQAGESPTLYLSPRLALQLATVLRRFALDCQRVRFAQSDLLTVELEEHTD